MKQPNRKLLSGALEPIPPNFPLPYLLKKRFAAGTVYKEVRKLIVLQLMIITF